MNNMRKINNSANMKVSAENPAITHTLAVRFSYTFTFINP